MIQHWTRTLLMQETTHPTTKRATHSSFPRHIFVWVAHRDHLVYLAQPSLGGGSSTTDILTPLRIQRLFYEMMPHLQQGEASYIHAVRECTQGLDFYLRYGAPQFWERWYHSTTAAVPWWIILVFPCSIVFLSLWTIFVYLHWYQLKELYQKISFRGWLFYYQCRLWRHRMWPHQTVKAAHGTRYPVCPICLELFRSCSRKSWLGSDGRPCTVLGCGHAYDTTCWTKWMNCYALNNGHRILSCAICRQEV
jgi:hypothetical protein